MSQPHQQCLSNMCLVLGTLPALTYLQQTWSPSFGDVCDSGEAPELRGSVTCLAAHRARAGTGAADSISPNPAREGAVMGFVRQVFHSWGSHSSESCLPEGTLCRQVSKHP
jgi:hypothetical protein